MSIKASSVTAPGTLQRHALGRGVAALGMLVGRSLFPLIMVVILGGTLLWGPWTTMILAIAWFAAISLLG
jgi:hypothetical protein